MAECQNGTMANRQNDNMAAQHNDRMTEQHKGSTTEWQIVKLFHCKILGIKKFGTNKFRAKHTIKMANMGQI